MVNATSTALPISHYRGHPGQNGWTRNDLALSSSAGKLGNLGDQLQAEFSAAYGPIDAAFGAIYRFAIHGECSPARVHFLDRLVQQQKWKCWAARLLFAVIALILLHDLILVVLVSSYDALTRVSTPNNKTPRFPHSHNGRLQRESSVEDIDPAFFAADELGMTKCRLTYGQVPDVGLLQRMKEREDMAFIRDFGVMPNGSIWKEAYWKQNRGWENRVRMALEDEDLVYRT